jgi:SAM-dependent methyltransferase
LLRRALRKARRWLGVRYNRIEAAVYDWRNGTDTGGKIAAAELDIPDELAGHVTGFQAVNEAHLRAALDTLPFPPNSVFVDIGCGKGKPLLIAARYPYVVRAMGVELSEALCQAARRNMEVARARGELSVPIEILQADALSIDFSRGENIFFLNNPFDADLMIRFISRLEAGAARDGRTIWMLYYNPVHGEAIIADGRMRKTRELSFFGPGRDIHVFELKGTR